MQFTLNGERIRIDYTSGLAGQKRTNTFDLEPLSLVSCRGALYLLARRLTNENRAIDPPATDYAEDVRTFSIQRIDARRGGRESFDYPRRAQFDPSTFFDGHFGIYRRRDRASKVEVELVYRDGLIAKGTEVLGSRRVDDAIAEVREEIARKRGLGCE